MIRYYNGYIKLLYKDRVAISSGKPELSPVFDLEYWCPENQFQNALDPGFGKKLKTVKFRKFFWIIIWIESQNVKLFNL